MRQNADVLDIAIIGCGHLGTRHAATLAGLPDVRVTMLIDPLPDAIEKLRREAGLEGVPGTASLDEALSRDDVDAVVIATHHDLHPPQAIAAAQAGKHIFVEKPLALTVEACRAIEAAVTRAGIQLVVGFQARHCPFVRRARAAVPHPRVLVGQMIDPRWGDASWAQNPATGGGNVLSQGVHTFDLICHLAGAEPVALHAEGGTFTHDPAATEVIDTVVATLHFANGAVASLAIGDFGPSLWAGKSFYQLFDAAGHTATIYRYYEGVQTAYRRKAQDVTLAGLTPEEQADPLGYRGEIKEFVACARENRPPQIAAGLRDGVRATTLAHAAFESIRTGRTVTLPFNPHRA